MIRLLKIIVFASFMNIHLYAKPLHLRVRRNALKDPSRLWPNGTIYYTLDSAYTHSEFVIIRQAMKDIQSVSCVRFKKRSDEESYVAIVKGEGCRADVGYRGGQQDLTLGEGCIDSGTVLHELFHTLGFYHEHARPDRDRYVVVFENNVKPAHLHNFEKKSPWKVDTFGLPYDFASVVHYSPNEFAVDRSKNTLKSLSGVYFTGEVEKLSDTDILNLNKLYRCHKNKTKSEYWSRIWWKYPIIAEKMKAKKVLPG